MAVGQRVRDVLALLLVVVAWCVVFYGVWHLAGGCVTQPKVLSPGEVQKIVGAEVGRMLSPEHVEAIAAAVVHQLDQSAGRDINEPWTGRILAVVSGLWPAALLVVYAASNRWRLTRGVLEWAKGRQNGNGA